MKLVSHDWNRMDPDGLLNAWEKRRRNWILGGVNFFETFFMNNRSTLRLVWTDRFTFIYTAIYGVLVIIKKQQQIGHRNFRSVKIFSSVKFFLF